MENTIKTGGISVQTEHIFPVIKKWLYSEKDIFLREIVSNASDAVTKLKRLASLGQYDSSDEAYRIDVTLDKTAKTLTVSDNGIGMTAEELDRYICQIALSGALEFVEKYEGENKNNGIIGHFGLGFYSSFMVSDTVELITKSYTDAPAVHWVCNTDGAYETSVGEREAHGTTVIMHISDEESAYLEKSKIEEILEKYCAFMPVEVYFSAESDEEDADKKDAKEKQPINDTTPLWLKNPSDCTPEEYKEFYRKVFHDWREPLFWIHVNADYPLNFRGILYFPKITNEYESIEGQVKLYYNQVFVADNIKEVIPEYLLMLKGVLDCPELPLNVSRSYLQNNTYVSKVSAHIVKKVADKLNSLCNTAREEYEKVWDDISTFVEYACMRDRKFYDRVSPSLLLKLTDGSYTTTADYLEKAKETHENTVYYTSDKATQAQYISMFEAQGIAISVFERQLDTQFLSMIESYNSDVKYVRIDADLAGALKSNETAAEDKSLAELFVKVSGNDKLKVTFSALKDPSVPLLLTISEESRRMEEMMKMYAMAGMGGMGAFPTEATLTVNTASPLIEKVAGMDAEKQEKTVAYLYRLALLSQRKLTCTFCSGGFRLLFDRNQQNTVRSRLCGQGVCLTNQIHSAAVGLCDLPKCLIPGLCDNHAGALRIGVGHFTRIQCANHIQPLTGHHCIIRQQIASQRACTVLTFSAGVHGNSHTAAFVRRDCDGILPTGLCDLQLSLRIVIQHLKCSAQICLHSFPIPTYIGLILPKADIYWAHYIHHRIHLRTQCLGITFQNSRDRQSAHCRLYRSNRTIRILH